MGKRLLTLVLDVQKLHNFPITVKESSNSRCLVDVYISASSCTSCYMVYAINVLYISAWASALLVLTVMGNAKASARGTGNSRQPTLFYMVP